MSIINRRSGSSRLTLRMWEFTGTALLSLFLFIIILAYLLPLAYMAVTAVKTPQQLSDSKSPIYPAVAQEYQYNGELVPIYKVPLPGGVKELALVEAHTKYSDFIDPQNPEAGLIRWNGYYRSLPRAYRFHLTLENFPRIWKLIDFPHLIRNTFIVALLAEIGILISSIAVAYGFSRFRIPYGRQLFLLLIATIIIPESVTLVPTYFMFTRLLGWNGTYLPLVVPLFFGSAIFIFLLRQNFRSIPRELDEAAMLDGAGPLRILVTIIIPQSIPAIVTVGLLQFFYTWNEIRNASLYLGVAPHLRTIAYATQVYVSLGFTPEMLEATALIVLAIPVAVLFLMQRYFMQDMVVTGLEK
jgi:multiple sugar transport system permease protein